MATIKIQRTKEYINSMRDYHIYIDGKKAGAVGNGQLVSFEIIPGYHTIVAKVDWCSSQVLSFEIRDKDTKTFSVGGFKHSSWLMPLSFGILCLHFILKAILYFFFDYTLPFSYVTILMLPAFFFLINYITIGRKKYLTLKEL